MEFKIEINMPEKLNLGALKVRENFDEKGRFVERKIYYSPDDLTQYIADKERAIEKNIEIIKWKNYKDYLQRFPEQF